MITMNDLKGSGAKFFGAGGSGPVSWNDLTDKPFYEEEVLTAVIAEQTVETTGGENNSSLSYDKGTLQGDIPQFEEGEYLVVHDGVRYECKCVKVPSMFATIYKLGNARVVSAGSVSTGEPFYLEIDTTTPVTKLYSQGYTGSAPHTIAVYKSAKITHRLSPEFGTSVVINVSDKENIESTYDEVKSLLSAGYQVSVRDAFCDYYLTEKTNEFFGFTACGASLGAVWATTVYLHTDNTTTWNWNDLSALVVRSSTADSTKRFKITVDDAGTISATEVTE